MGRLKANVGANLAGAAVEFIERFSKRVCKGAPLNPGFEMRGQLKIGDFAIKVVGTASVHFNEQKHQFAAQVGAVGPRGFHSDHRRSGFARLCNGQGRRNPVHVDDALIVRAKDREPCIEVFAKNLVLSPRCGARSARWSRVELPRFPIKQIQWFLWWAFDWYIVVPRLRNYTMASNSHIEWTDATWNPVTGCTKISPGCKHCCTHGAFSPSSAGNGAGQLQKRFQSVLFSRR